MTNPRLDSPIEVWFLRQDQGKTLCPVLSSHAMEYLMRLANVVLICLLLGQVRAARNLLATCTAGQEFQLESNGICNTNAPCVDCANGNYQTQAPQDCLDRCDPCPAGYVGTGLTGQTSQSGACQLPTSPTPTPTSTPVPSPIPSPSPGKYLSACIRKNVHKHGVDLMSNQQALNMLNTWSCQEWSLCF